MTPAASALQVIPVKTVPPMKAELPLSSPSLTGIASCR